MATDLHRFTISFPDGYDDRLEFETPSKGYLRDVMVHLDDGSSYKLFFIDLIRLQQDLQADVANGREHYAQPGMVVLLEVTTQNIQKAVAGLLQESFFEQLKPLPKPVSDKLRG